MRKKYLIINLLGVFLLVCPYLSAQTIPKELQNLGFTEKSLLSYDKEGNEEFFTFKDSSAAQEGETTTFVVVNGEVKQKIAGQVAKFLEQNQ
jgi:hypothetical protein